MKDMVTMKEIDTCASGGKPSSLNGGWSPHDFINAAGDTIDQRGTDNGYDAGQERSAAKVAELFNTLTGHVLTEQDAWLFLICLKLVRNQKKFKQDNIVDLIGYAALLGESLDSPHAVDLNNDAN